MGKIQNWAMMFCLGGGEKAERNPRKFYKPHHRGFSHQARSIEGVITLLQDNDALIKQVMEAPESATSEIEQMSMRVEQGRHEAQVLVDQLRSVEFVVGKQEETKVRQKALLEVVEALWAKSETFSDVPLRRGIYAAEISNIYPKLGNTFISETHITNVPFSQHDLRAYKDMLRKATLDVPSRKKRAAVIKAASQISRLAINVARKPAMA